MPYRMAFITTEFLGPWFIAELIIDFLFFCDVMFNCITSYVTEDGWIVTSRRKIFVRYARSWMLLDLAACIPFSVFEDEGSLSDDSSHEDSTSYNHFLRLFRLPRLYRLFRIGRILKLLKARNS
jgi:hypothetical protein